MYLKPDQFNRPQQFNTVVEELVKCDTLNTRNAHTETSIPNSELKSLPKEIQKVHSGSSLKKFWRSSEIESQLGEIRDNLVNAVDRFRVGVHLTHVGQSRTYGLSLPEQASYHSGCDGRTY